MVLPPDSDPLRGLFTSTQRSWLYANMDLAEYTKLGELDEGDTVDPVVPMIKAMISRVGHKPLAPGVEKRSAAYVIALAKDLNAKGVGVPFTSKDWQDAVDKERDFFYPDINVLPPGETRITDEEGARREMERGKEKFNRPVPDYLQGVYAFPDELSGSIGKEPIPIPPEFITEFYFKVGPKTVLSKTLTESAPRTLNVKSVEEDPFQKGMWNIEVTDADNLDAPVPKITIQEVKLGINLFDMDGLYKMMVQELTAKKAPDWLIRRAEELRLIQKTRHTEDGNTELMVGAGASALLLLLLFI